MGVFWPAKLNVRGDVFLSRETSVRNWSPEYDADGEDEKLSLHLTGCFRGGEDDDEWPIPNADDSHLMWQGIEADTEAQPSEDALGRR